MTIQRMDNVGIVVDDVEAAIAFFGELGMELEGKAQIEGLWADRTVGLDGVRCDIAMLRTPDGHGRLELAKYHTLTAISTEPHNPPHNTLDMHRVMSAVDDVDTTVASPASTGRGSRWRGGAVPGQLPALLRPRSRGNHHRAGRAAHLTARRGRPERNDDQHERAAHDDRPSLGSGSGLRGGPCVQAAGDVENGAPTTQTPIRPPRKPAPDLRVQTVPLPWLHRDMAREGVEQSEVSLRVVGDLPVEVEHDDVTEQSAAFDLFALVG
jgi:catechol 2,3-dioxygenase-like lactoylglutathione lyase family enzyme